MIYVTGDLHGNQVLWYKNIHNYLNEGDTIIVVGDFGIGFFDGIYWPEEMFYDYLSGQNYQVLFIDGNHENFDKLKSYPIKLWNGGRVQFIRDNVIHLMRGEIYHIEGKKVFCMGGGYSLDKEYRVVGESWWKEEMPSIEEYDNASKNLESADYKVDYILSHTAPKDTVDYMSGLHIGIQDTVIEEYPLTTYLQDIAEKVTYSKWYFGHFHIDMVLPKNQFVLYNAIRTLETGDVVKMR